jgi:hypothetical protein
LFTQGDYVIPNTKFCDHMIGLHTVFAQLSNEVNYDTATFNLMSTLSYGCEYAGMSSSIGTSRASGQTRSGRSAHGIPGLPTPPGSTRPSIDNAPLPKDTTQMVSTQHASDSRLSSNLRPNDSRLTLFGPTVSPPASVISTSPPRTYSVQEIMLQLQPIFNSDARECIVDGVTPALFEAVKLKIMQGEEAGTWETLR